MIGILAAVDSTAVILAVVTGVFGGSLLAAIVAFRKVGPEKTQIIISSTEKAFIVQTGVIDDLNEELARQRAETERAREEARRSREEAREARAQFEAISERLSEVERTSPSLDVVTALQERNNELETELAAARSAADELKLRVGDLETELSRLKGGER